MKSATSKIFILAFATVAGPALADEPWTFKPSGRLQADYTFAEADASGLEVRAGELRTVRLGASGENGPLSFKLELAADSTGVVSVTDAHADYEFAEGWSVRAGQFRTPNSLDEQTSQRFTTNFERAAFTDAFEFDRRLGLGLFNEGNRHTFSAGVFAANLNDTALDEGLAAAARITFQPLKTDTLATHLGASLRWRETGEDQPLLRYRQRPFARDPGRIVSTGSIAGSDMFYGVEGAAILEKKSWLAAEYGLQEADRAVGGSATFSGGYVEAGHMIGGERTYKKGKWDRPKIASPVTKDGRGALMLAVRYDTLDLTDGAVDGGTLDTLVLAADWYATSHAHIGVNVFNADANFGSTSSGLGPAFAAARLAGVQGDEVTGVMVRLQFDF